MKIKRAATIICAVVMVMSLFSVPAFAYYEETTIGDASVAHECQLFGTSVFAAGYAFDNNSRVTRVTAEAYNEQGLLGSTSTVASTTYLDIQTPSYHVSLDKVFYGRSRVRYNVVGMGNVTIIGLEGSTTRRSAPAYRTTSRGESYGNICFEREDNEPDLIAATGINGVQGYVRRDELRVDYETTTFISVYDLNGTKLDTFLVEIITE